MVRISLFCLLLCSVLLVGCTGMDLDKLSDDDLARISGMAVICEEPYMRLGMGCCLDEDNNSICDKDEENKSDNNELLMNLYEKVNESKALSDNLKVEIEELSGEIDSIKEEFGKKVDVIEENLSQLKSNDTGGEYWNTSDGEITLYWDDGEYKMHDHKKCRGGHLYWYDSNDKRIDVAEICEFGCGLTRCNEAEIPDKKCEFVNVCDENNLCVGEVVCS